VVAACAVSTSSSNQTELTRLQVRGFEFLATLIECFGHSECPKLLAMLGSVPYMLRYSTQITSAVKYALSSEHLGLANACSFVIALLVKKGLVSDAVVVRRIVKPMIPQGIGISSCPLYEGCGDSEILTRIVGTPGAPVRLGLLERFVKLSVTAELVLFSYSGMVDEHIRKTLRPLLSASEDALAVNFAAFAIDCARLRKEVDERNASPSKQNNEKDTPIIVRRGLTFSDRTEIDTKLFDFIPEMLPVFSSGAALLLTRGKQLNLKKEWLKHIIPILFVGLHSSIENLAGEKVVSARCPQETLSIYLQGCRSILKAGLLPSDFFYSGEIGYIAQSISSKILFRSLDMGDDKNKSKQLLSGEVVLQSCGFLGDLVGLKIEMNDVNFDVTCLASCTLSVLSELQDGCIDLNGISSAKERVVVFCLQSAAKLFFTGLSVESDGNLGGKESALFNLSVGLLCNRFANTPQNIKEAALILLKASTASKNVDEKEKQVAVRQFSGLGLWSEWEMISSSINKTLGLLSSVDLIRKALENESNRSNQIESLSILRKYLQTKPNKAEAYLVMNELGGSILVQLQKYCGEQNEISIDLRQRVCAETIRLFISVFQHLTSDSPGEDLDLRLSNFLQLSCGIFVEVIVYNGLPNTMTPQGDARYANPSLGRLCAQTVVHVARVAPLPFKACLNGMPVECRGTLETAVRAEMSGYSGVGGSLPRVSLSSKLNRLK